MVDKVMMPCKHGVFHSHIWMQVGQGPPDSQNSYQCPGGRVVEIDYEAARLKLRKIIVKAVETYGGQGTDLGPFVLATEVVIAAALGVSDE